MKPYSLFFFTTALLGSSFASLCAQTGSQQRAWTSVEEVARVIEPYYQALKQADWAVVSVYCALTADSKPQQFYLDSIRGIDKESKWQFLRCYPANYTDPATGTAPDECRLVMSIYQVPGNSTKVPQARLDLWLRTNEKWHIIPEQEITHKTAIQINNVPLDGRGIGSQFDNLAAVEEKARSDRARQERDDAILNQAKIKHMEMKAKLLELSLNKDLTPDQKQSAMRQLMEEVRAATQEAKKEYDAVQEADVQNLKPTRTYTQPK